MKLRYTLPALADLESILDYIAARSPQGAQRVQARIKAILDLVLIHPRVGARTDDPTIRRVTTTPYPYLVFTRSPKPRSLFMRFATARAIRRECRVPGKPIYTLANFPRAATVAPLLGMGFPETARKS